MSDFVLIWIGVGSVHLWLDITGTDVKLWIGIIGFIKSELILLVFSNIWITVAGVIEKWIIGTGVFGIWIGACASRIIVDYTCIIGGWISTTIGINVAGIDQPCMGNAGHVKIWINVAGNVTYELMLLVVKNVDSMLVLVFLKMWIVVRVLIRKLLIIYRYYLHMNWYEMECEYW